MKNLTHKAIAISLVFTVFNACKKDFEEINTNPNTPTDVQPELLLRQVIYDFGEEMSYEGFVAGNLLGQYFAQVDFNLFDRHSLTEPQFGGNPWPFIYENLRDNELLLEKSRTSEIFSVYEAPALIMKAYMAATLTDIYGDVPYTQALKGTKGIVRPAYDSQEDIYLGTNGILDNLDMAIALIESSNYTQELNGDILYNGDLSAWLKFANSLKIKYLMRISGRVDVADRLSETVLNGQYMQSNADNAIFNFTNSQPNNFRMANLREGDFNLFVLSETMEEQLARFNDPRLNVFYRPIGNDSTGATFKGLLNGPDASQTSISISDFSLTGRIFREETGSLKANFMTAWETSFLLAEASLRNLITDNVGAQMRYEIGVRQAFEYWNTSIPDSYLTTDSSAYAMFGADPLEQIITQKWIAQTINGYEGWIEYRRTGFPNLKTITASLNNNLIPNRLPYPTDEDALNNTNFLRATATNGNSVNTAVWWDVN